VLNVSKEYLMNDEEIFIETVRENYGSKGAQEAANLLEQNKGRCLQVALYVREGCIFIK